MESRGVRPGVVYSLSLIKSHLTRDAVKPLSRLTEECQTVSESSPAITGLLIITTQFSHRIVTKILMGDVFTYKTLVHACAGCVGSCTAACVTMPLTTAFTR